MNNKVYIGSTPRCIRQRFGEHLYQGTFGSTAKKDLKIEIIEICEGGERFERENFYIKKYNSIESGYNKCIAGNGPCGWKPSNKQIRSRERSKAFNMPFFKVTKLGTPSGYLITNSYDRAASFTGYSKSSVRKKVKYNVPCKKFKYEYLEGVI